MTKQVWSGLAAALVCIATLAACSPSTSDEIIFTCSASTCTGCCKGNTCVAPPDETACGTGGGSCKACSSTEVCSQGHCVPNDCAGCVDPTNFTCESGTAASACGQDGVFCATCGPGTICQNGKCVSDVCNGCKDGSNTCQPGTSNTACGQGGAACAACTGTETCQDHACQAPATCNATTCSTGCCDANDMCQTGNTVDACGTGGAACSTCSGMGATCTSGACKVPCGPGNCVGCCDPIAGCVASVDATCGINGVTCQACGAGSACSSGKCVANSCKSTCPGCCNGSSCQLGTNTMACGVSGNSCTMCSAGQVCASGTCQVDPNSLWDFIATSGEAPLRDKNMDTWDSFGGLPDPYVELDLSYGQPDQLIGFGDFINNTITPDWTTATKKGKVVSGVKASLLLKASYLQMWDSDDFVAPSGLDDDMGFCSFSITQGMFNGALQSKTCMSSQGVTWKIFFKIVPHT